MRRIFKVVYHYPGENPGNHMTFVEAVNEEGARNECRRIFGSGVVITNTVVYV